MVEADDYNINYLVYNLVLSRPRLSDLIRNDSSVSHVNCHVSLSQYEIIISEASAIWESNGHTTLVECH